MNYYTVVFNIPFMESEAIVTVERISDVESGFWVTKGYAFTKGSDCKYWIPPSNILYVEKEDD